jgi:hypothetical protein
MLAYAAQCDKCEHDRAYFYQLQIRSADEPMTTCASGCACVRVACQCLLVTDQSLAFYSLPASAATIL